MSEPETLIQLARDLNDVAWHLRALDHGHGDLAARLEELARELEDRAVFIEEVDTRG